jgi:hypothetical protein
MCPSGRQSDQELPPHRYLETLTRRISAFSFRERINFFRDQRIPRFLYKFRAAPDTSDSLHSITDIILNSKLWLSSPADFNDPFDMARKMVLQSTGVQRRRRINELLKGRLNFEERGKRTAEWMKKPIAELEKMIQSISQKQTSRTGICSFADDPLNILMWSHDASKHRGICCQFDVALDPSLFALPIEYSEEYPVVNWIINFNKDNLKAMLRKHSGWSYERESRIILLDHARRPYHFRPEALSALILGCRADEESILKLVSDRRSNGLPKPKLYRAIRHDRKYKITLRSF